MGLGAEAQAVDGVGPTVRPLTELVWGFGEGHVWGDGAVDDGLRQTQAHGQIKVHLSSILRRKIVCVCVWESVNFVINKKKNLIKKTKNVIIFYNFFFFVYIFLINLNSSLCVYHFAQHKLLYIIFSINTICSNQHIVTQH